MIFYYKNIFRFFDIRDGGLAIYGGFIAGILLIIIYTRKKKIDILNLLDAIIPYVALAQSIGRWGNFINIEAYGKETQSFLKMGIIENGIYKEVHPTFLYESAINFIFFILLLKLKNHRKYKGQIIYFYIALYSIARIIIEQIRVDSLMLGNIRISQLVSIILLIISITIIIKKNVKQN